MRWASLILLAGCGRIAFDSRIDASAAGDGATPDTACMPSTAASALQPRSSMSVGASPYGVAVVDMNGDGQLDLVTASNADYTVSVFIGDGNGGFGMQQTFATGANPFGVAVGDLDGDGRNDVVTANPGGNSISVLLGNGNGTLRPKTDYTTHAGPRIPALLPGPNGLDIVVNAGLDASFGLFPNNGDGTFQAVQPYGAGAHPYAIGAGDLDHNGFPDVAMPDITDLNIGVSLAGSSFHAFPGNPTTYAAGATPQALALADLDGDSFLDIVEANTDGNVYVLANNRSGMFTLRDTKNAGSNPVAVITADLNGDGVFDVATANQGENTVGLLAGNGDGTLQPVTKVSTGVQPYALTAGDVDRDGRNDLLVADNADGNVSVMLGTCVH